MRNVAGLTAHDIQSRLDRITATDVTAVMGTSPWRSKHDVYLEKCVGLAPQEPSPAMLWGQLMEPPLLLFAEHARQELGRFATAPGHIPTEKTSKVEKGTAWLLQQTALLGPQVGQWSQEMLQARGIPGVRVLVGLLALARRHPGVALDRACQIAASHQAYRLRAIRELLKPGAESVGEQNAFEFIQTHPIIRGLGEYDALVREALRGSEPALATEGP